MADSPRTARRRRLAPARCSRRGRRRRRVVPAACCSDNDRGLPAKAPPRRPGSPPTSPSPPAALAEIRAVREAVERDPGRFPASRSTLAPLVALHQAHEATLVDAVPERARPSASAGAVRRAAQAREGTGQARRPRAAAARRPRTGWRCGRRAVSSRGCSPAWAPRLHQRLADVAGMTPVQALQKALAAEHAAVHLYGFLGGAVVEVAPAGAVSAARRDLRGAPRLPRPPDRADQREGQRPGAAEVDYAVPGPTATPAQIEARGAHDRATRDQDLRRAGREHRWQRPALGDHGAGRQRAAGAGVRCRAERVPGPELTVVHRGSNASHWRRMISRIGVPRGTP